jgi:hypothetical protein
MLAGEKGSEGGVGAAPPAVTRALLLPACTSAPRRLLLRIMQAQQHQT